MKEESKKVKLVTVDPGHFHAALVQKSMYKNVDSVVHVYAPEGPDVIQHLERIESYNTRETDPTSWNEKVYTGPDFFEKMIQDKAGNVVVLSGNNRKKSEYILRSLESGFNVLADKPMVINKQGYGMLKQAFLEAEKNNLLLYDIMTERYEITTILQRQLSRIPEIFGTLEKGSPENPAITKESVHHLFKYVSGSILTRPAWFLDVEQQGEGIVDVMTHLVDLVQWECFPNQLIDTNDIEIIEGKRWTTDLTLSEFSAITKMEQYPEYLLKNVVNDTLLQIYCNGAINYKLRGIHAKTSVTWAYKAPEGAGDTHYSIMRGSKVNLVIRQGEAENFKPTLYIEPVSDDASYESSLIKNFSQIQKIYSGVELQKSENGWMVVIPEEYKKGHEAHFGQVMEKFLEYLEKGNLPEWEIPNMIAKYYTTTLALELAK
ncbi:MAG: oxidoreductase [Bacteroidales bacterium]|nr:oxidoreductase [Bacteroidales bacterium]